MAVLLLSIIVEEQGRNRLYSQWDCEFLIVINVDFANLSFVSKFIGNFFQNWTQCFTGATPGCPKIYNQWGGGTGYGFLECFFVKFF